MNTATELMRRALDALHFDLSAKESAKVAEEIRAFLAAEEERKPKFIRKKVCWNCGWPIQETRPEPARKPMTEEEINRELPFECSGIYFDGFRDGIDFAEKHHFGIGINQSDPDSIDLQSRCRGDKL